MHAAPTMLARDVFKSFGSGRDRTPILRGSAWRLARGESVFLVGPSGSGKTTLLSLLGCILTPDRGARVLGQEVSGCGPEQLAAFRRDHLGFVFQSFNLFPTLSAAGQRSPGALHARRRALGTARARAAELLDQVGLCTAAHGCGPPS